MSTAPCPRGETRTYDCGLLTGEAWTNGARRQAVQMLSRSDCLREAAAGGLGQDDATVARCAATALMRALDG